MMLGVSVMAQDKNAITYSKVISPERGKAHLSILASDEYEGRETGTKGAWMAAEYIKKQFKGLGLTGPVKDSKDPYFQNVELVTYELTGTTLTVNGKAQPTNSFVISNNSVALSGLNINANEVVFAGYGLTKEGYNDYEGLNVEGKVVMVFTSGDPSGKPAENTRASMQARSNMLGALIKAKAKAILLIDPNAGKMPPAAGRLMVKNKETEAQLARPVAFIAISIAPSVANEILKASGNTVEGLQKKITETGKPASLTVPVTISSTAQKKEVMPRAENVLGFLEGSDPKLKNEVLVLTSHYDHIGLVRDPNAKDKVNNGADDDGSGTTGVLLMAEAFAKAKKAGKGPKRSILFMTVVGEEKGLLGSQYYSEHPIFSVENTIANLNTDMIGRIGEEYLGKPDSANYVYSVGSVKLSTELGKISEDINNTYTKIKLDYKFDDPKDPQQIYYRSDHYNFAKLGIPVIFFYDGMLEQDYHQPGDEVSKINFPLLAKRAQLIYHIAWDLANRPTRPVVDKKPDGATRR